MQCFNYWLWEDHEHRFRDPLGWWALDHDRSRGKNYQQRFFSAWLAVEESMAAEGVTGKRVQQLAGSALASAQWHEESELSWRSMSRAQRDHHRGAWLTVDGNYDLEWTVDIPADLARARLLSLPDSLLYAYALFWSEAWTGRSVAETVALRRVAEFAKHLALVAVLGREKQDISWWLVSGATAAESIDYHAAPDLDLWNPRADPRPDTSFSEWEKTSGGTIEVHPEKLREEMAPRKKKGDGWGPRPWDLSWWEASGSGGGGTGKKPRLATVIKVGHVGKADMERQFLKLGSEPGPVREFLEQEAKKAGHTIPELVATVGRGKKRALMSDEERQRSDRLAQLAAAASELKATYEAIGIALFDEPAKTTARKLVLRGRELGDEGEAA